MNSCILMAEIIRAPELRYTSDNQTPIAEMMVQFPGLRPEDPAATMKVVGWGNLAQEIQERFRQGDQVVIEGRLTMNTVDRPEGFKEKRAELTAQRIHTIGAGASLTASTVTSGEPMGSQPVTPVRSTPAPSAKSTAGNFQPVSAPPTTPDYDDIPF